MAKGSKSLNTWDHWVSRLRVLKCRYRIARKKEKPFILIREYDGKNRLREFSSGLWRPESDVDIEAAAKACLAAHKAGKWPKRKGEVELSWSELAENARMNLRERVPRIGSRKNPEQHLNAIATFSGAVKTATLENWAKQCNPVTQPIPFASRIKTLSHINKAGDIDLSETIQKLKGLKLTGSAKKLEDQRTQEIHAIPTDDQMQAWLDGLEGWLQWTLALIATYGLRPHEAWHAENIDDDGWITIPGEGKTKSVRHFAPPVPEHWLERYQLKSNFKLYQAELNERWKIKWIDKKGLLIPINNSEVTNLLYRNFYAGAGKKLKLWVDDEWMRPYDLRHSYAIRCETSTDPIMLRTDSKEFANWLGHGFDMHRRVYLKFMTAERRKDSRKARLGKQRSADNSFKPEDLPEDIQQKLAKLEQQGRELEQQARELEQLKKRHPELAALAELLASMPNHTP